MRGVRARHAVAGELEEPSLEHGERKKGLGKKK